MKYLKRFRFVVIVVICLATITGIAHSQLSQEEPEWWYYSETIDDDLTYAGSIDGYWHVNIREFPGNTFAVIGSMPPDCYLRIEATIGDWHQVALLGDLKGYVYSKSVREVPGDQIDEAEAQDCT